MNFREDLLQIKVEIEQHDLLEVVAFEMAPPASEAAIEAVEDKLQLSLDHHLKEFYRQMNGCHLHWQLKSLTLKEYDALVYEKYGRYEPHLEDDDENPFAQIKFNSLEKCFLEDWFQYDQSNDYEFLFVDKQYLEHKFSQKLKILDEFSSFACVAYLTQPQFSQTPLIMLSGHFADWWNSHLIDFQTYWQLLIKSRGIYEIKQDILGKMDGHKLPAIKNLDDFQQYLQPKLFDKSKS